MLRWRILLGIFLTVALVGLCWLDHHLETTRGMMPGVALAPVAIVFILMAGREVLQLAAVANMRPLSWMVHCGNLLLLASNLIPLSWWQKFPSEHPVAPGSEPLFALGLVVLLVFGGEMYRFQKPGGVLANVAVAVFSVVYIGLMFSCMAQLRIIWGIWALASLIVVVKAADIGAYTVGRLVGRTKMAPILSPGKTVEGAIGALTFACLASWVTFVWLMPLTVQGGEKAGQSWGWIPFGLLVGAAGMVGDLAESLIKRDVGRKNSSSWLPGFGGVLDIVDSLLLAAPVAWFCWAMGLVGR